MWLEMPWLEVAGWREEKACYEGATMTLQGEGWKVGATERRRVWLCRQEQMQTKFLEESPVLGSQSIP